MDTSDTNRQRGLHRPIGEMVANRPVLTEKGYRAIGVTERTCPSCGTRIETACEDNAVDGSAVR